MEGDPFEKQMFSTNSRDRNFNVRKVPYKEYQNEKYQKSNFSPFQKKQRMHEPSTTMPKKAEYLPVSIASSAYKQLVKKYQALKQQTNGERQRKLQKMKQKEDELCKYKQQRQRLQSQRAKLHQRRDQIKFKIQQIRERNQSLRQQRSRRNESIRAINMQDLRQMILAMRYQNGLEIDTDNMTYEQLLQLQEKMGSVSKGITAQTFQQLQRLKGQSVQGQLCSICYNNIGKEEQVNKLPCQHLFHVDCIKEWLCKEKTCPLCKQQIQRTK